MSVRNSIGLLLLIISLICLYPGVTKPLLQIQVNAKLPLIGSLELYNETQSIIESIEALWNSQNRLVSVLILLFSILIPVVKAILLLSALGLQQIKSGNHLQYKLVNVIQMIGKWSMADVFVVSIFMAFLATQSNDFLEAILHPGFYYFLAYCLISIISSLLIAIPTHETIHSEEII